MTDYLLNELLTVTCTLGQLIEIYGELAESILDQTQTRLGREKIDSLKKQIETEQDRLAKIKHAQQRKKELEKLRQDQDKAAGKKSQQNEVQHGSKTIQLLDGKGKLVAWLQVLGKDRVNILDARGRLVAKEISGMTFDKSGKFMGRGRQGLRVLGMNQRQ